MLRDVKKTCPVCGLSFKTLFKFKEHLFQHSTSLGGKKVRCHVDHCDKIIENSQLYDHVLFGHFGDTYKLKCDQCDFKTTTSSKLKNHLMVHMDERPFKCTQCDKGFRNNSKLTEHIEVIHKKDKNVACNQCGETFSSTSQLTKHKTNRHSNKIFVCQVCEKAFTSNQSLGAHMRNVHKKSNDRTVCSVCGSMHGSCKCENVQKQAEIVSCPVCAKKLSAKNLPSHLHYHRQSTLRPYICQECSQTFTHASSLKRHALLHTGERQYKCEKCGKEFFQKVAYETHCKSHTKERLHCKGCQQPFLTKYLLNFHLKSKAECRKIS